MNDRSDTSLREAGDLINARRPERTNSTESVRTRNNARGEVADEPLDEYEADELDVDDDEEDADASNPDTGDEESGDDDISEGEDAGDDADAASEREHVVKVDGKESKVKTSELVAGYQRSQDYHNKTQALAQRGRELSGGHTKIAETYASELSRIGNVLGGVKQMLAGDMTSQEMANLRATNPQQWLVARETMQDRITQIDAVFNQLNSQYERHARDYAQQNQANIHSTLEHERTLLVRAIPDWEGEGKERLAKYLGRQGFRAEDLEGITDARMLLAAEKARKWDEHVAKRDKPAVKTLKQVPRSVKPGQGQIRKGNSQGAATKSDFQKAKAHAQKTGSMRDAGAAIAKLLR